MLQPSNALVCFFLLLIRIAPTKDDLQWIVDLGFGVLVLRPMGKRDCELQEPLRTDKHN